MNKKGFTLVEIIVCVAIISVIGVVIGLNSDKMFKKEEVEPVQTKIESAAAVYAEGNKGVVESLYAGTDRFIELTVGELIDSGLIDENIIGEEYPKEENGTTTNDTIDRDEKIVVTLDSSGELKFTFGSDTRYGFFRADDIVIANGDPYECNYSINNDDKLNGSQLMFIDKDKQEITNMVMVTSEAEVDADKEYYCNIESKRIDNKLPFVESGDNEYTEYTITYIYKIEGLKSIGYRKVKVMKPLSIKTLTKDKFTISTNRNSDFTLKEDNNKYTIYKNPSVGIVTINLNEIETNYDEKIQLVYQNNTSPKQVDNKFTNLGEGTHTIKVYPIAKKENNYTNEELLNSSITNHLNAASTTIEIKNAPAITISSLVYTDASGKEETVKNANDTAIQKEGKKVKVNIDSPVQITKTEYKLDNGTWKELNSNNLITTPSKKIKIRVTNELEMTVEAEYNFNVVKTIANTIGTDPDCENVKNGDGCYYRGDEDSNYVEYAGKTWRIFQKDSSNQLHLILNTTFDTANYYFSEFKMYGYCSNDSCCNDGAGYIVDGESNPYLVNATNDKLNGDSTGDFYESLSTPKNKIIDYNYKATYENYSNYGNDYISKGGVSISKSYDVSYSRKVGLLNYRELSIISGCTAQYPLNTYYNFGSCGSSYLNDVSNKWGLATTTVASTGTTYFGSSYKYKSDQIFTYFYTLGYSNGVLSHVKGDAKVKVNQNAGWRNPVVATEDEFDKETNYVGEKLYLRPVVVLSDTAVITGGNGTVNNAYKIG